MRVFGGCVYLCGVCVCVCVCGHACVCALEREHASLCVNVVCVYECVYVFVRLRVC
jgi:hypothetical protein